MKTLEEYDKAVSAAFSECRKDLFSTYLSFNPLYKKITEKDEKFHSQNVTQICFFSEAGES